MPVVLLGHNLVAWAAAGEGKTLLSVVAIMMHLLEQPCLAGQANPMALIITSTSTDVETILGMCHKFAPTSITCSDNLGQPPVRPFVRL